MKSRDTHACDEYNVLNRRQFFRATLAGAAAAMAGPAWLPRVAYAQDGVSNRDVIISIFLRGGADGLTLCVPHGENAYYNERGNHAIPPPDATSGPKAIDLDGFFGLPPAMAPLRAVYQAGDLLVVHATGSTDDSRSHFEAQFLMEVGADEGNPVISGWLARHLLTTAPLSATALLRAVALNESLQQTLTGAPQALPVPEPGDFRLQGPENTADARLATLLAMYAATPDPLKAAAENTEATIDLLNGIDFAGYRPAGGATYAEEDFGQALRASAALIKAEVGVEAIAIDLGGWDTHVAQGGLDGHMANLMKTLAEGLAAFHTDLAGGPNVTVVVMSEFGRTAHVNFSGGTDHGHGGVMLAMGPGITGGRVLSEWPGLELEQRFQGRDLAITIDYRDVLAEILANRLGNTALSDVFPNYAPTFRGVTA